MSRVMKALPLAALCVLIIAVPSVWADWPQDGIALCAATGDQAAPQSVSDGAGGAIITWRDGRGGNDDIYAQRVDASGTILWTTDGVAICTATGDQECPYIVSDNVGGAIITWHDYRNGSDDDIYAQRVNASGSALWATDGVALCTAAGNQWHPRITTDGWRGAIVTWYDYRNGNADIYAQSVYASGLIRWETNGVAICAAAGDQSYPQIVSDDADGAIVRWYSYGGSCGYNVHAQRVNASGAAQWGTDGVILASCTPINYQYYASLASDGAGGAIVTWLKLRNPNYADIYAQRVNASGAVQWSAGGVVLCAAAGSRLYPAVISDGAGGAIAAWSDNRGVDGYDIYGQRVDASGSVLWSAGGVPLCTAPEDQHSPTLVADGAGGAIVTWHDYRDGSIDIGGDTDVYAQRVNSSGAVQWELDGVALCTEAGNQAGATIVSDGAFGAIVAWHDYRGVNYDIYARWVDVNGFEPPTNADAPALPIALNQNYPNPFNPVTTVTYMLPERCEVTLKIYDASGTCVICLVETEQEKGYHRVEWNGRDSEGKPVATGILFCRLTAGRQTASRKMVLLR